MAETINFGISEEEAIQLSVLIEQCLQSIDEVDARIEQEEIKTARLQEETRSIINQLRNTFNAQANL